MITVYGFPKTRSTRIVWALEELELPYQFHRVDLASGEHRGEAYRKIHPGGKIPALQDGDFILTESLAIVSYLARKRPDSGLIPGTDEPEKLARYDQWGCFAIAELEQPLWTMGKHKFALPAERRVPDVLDTAAWELQVALELLSQGLGHQDFILGDTFTAADILLGHTLFWALGFKQPVQHANLVAYIDRLKARTALQRAWAREAQSEQ